MCMSIMHARKPKQQTYIYGTIFVTDMKEKVLLTSQFCYIVQTYLASAYNYKHSIILIIDKTEKGTQVHMAVSPSSVGFALRLLHCTTGSSHA